MRSDHTIRKFGVTDSGRGLSRFAGQASGYPTGPQHADASVHVGIQSGFPGMGGKTEGRGLQSQLSSDPLLYRFSIHLQPAQTCICIPPPIITVINCAYT